LLLVTNAADVGTGSLRSVLIEANEAESLVRIEVQLDPGTVIEVLSALPPLRAPGAVLEGGGAILRSSEDCERPDGRFGCDGLVLRGPNITVRNLVAQNFLFDGFAVRGSAARGTTIRGCASMNNSDDGFGVSEGAQAIVIRDCVSIDNGFRTKGKGILVFDDSNATLIGNVLIGNRDGLTISRRARAEVRDTAVIGSFDKGVGVAGAELIGSDNLIAANGLSDDDSAPNADGLRATLGSRVRLVNTEISASGDTGVIALQGSEIELVDSRVFQNARYGVAAATEGVVTLIDTEVTGSGELDIYLHDARSRIFHTTRALRPTGIGPLQSEASRLGNTEAKPAR
jgi:hypothetical protein